MKARTAKEPGWREIFLCSYFGPDNDTAQENLSSYIESMRGSAYPGEVELRILADLYNAEIWTYTRYRKDNTLSFEVHRCSKNKPRYIFQLAHVNSNHYVALAPNLDYEGELL